MENDGEDRDHIAKVRERHVGRLLLQAQRAFNAQALAKLRARGYDRLGVAHTAVLPHIDLDGTRVTTLAERAGMTKQGMGQLIADLEAQGLVSRAPDPADGRATLVRFTDAGWDYLKDAAAIKQELEAEYAELLGVDQFVALCQSLSLLIEHEQRGTERTRETAE